MIFVKEVNVASTKKGCVVLGLAKKRENPNNATLSNSWTYGGLCKRFVGSDTVPIVTRVPVGEVTT